MQSHGESIYNLIPKIQEQVEKPPMHKSKFNHEMPPTASTFHTKGSTHPVTSNLAGNAQKPCVPQKESRTMGKVSGATKKVPENYTKKYEKTEKVASLAEVKVSNPELLVPTQLSTSVMPKVPRASEAAPICNLVTKKNFVVANAVETILAAPKKVTDNAKDYLSKEDYGKTPKYLQHIKSDIEAEYDYIKALQQQQADEAKALMRPMEEQERLELIDQLKAKWEATNTEYQGQTHITKLDTHGKKYRKEKYEAEMSQIEKDIEKLNKKNILIDATM